METRYELFGRPRLRVQPLAWRVHRAGAIHDLELARIGAISASL